MFEVNWALALRTQSEVRVSALIIKNEKAEIVRFELPLPLQGEGWEEYLIRMLNTISESDVEKAAIIQDIIDHLPKRRRNRRRSRR